MKTLKELFVEPRMYYAPLSDNNSVAGLFEMVKEIVQPNFVMAEIGSFSGVSSELFARFVKQIYCVDIWTGYLDTNYTEVSHERLNTSYETFKLMANDYNNIIPMKMPSLEAAKKFNDGVLDLVYIDGRHDVESVIEDITAWLPKIKKGGWITGHDILIDVRLAVEKVLGKNYKTYIDESWAMQIS
jgi:predicted O-methyltransferase YrrM